MVGKGASRALVLALILIFLLPSNASHFYRNDVGNLDYFEDSEEDITVTKEGEMGATQGDISTAKGAETGTRGMITETFSITMDIKPGEKYYVYYDKLNATLLDMQMPDEIEALPQEAKDALAIVPQWLYKKLADTFIGLSDSDAVTYANLILNATNPKYVDEIAFSIAHTHKSILGWMKLNSYENIIVDNVETIYWVDSQGLAYASLVEKGDYTTLNYSGESGWEELERDKYYWYVVYPRAYLELPQYWNGDFWRDFLLTDTTYGSSLYNYVKDATSIQDAATKAGEWIQIVMIFQFGTNYLQPIEIYQERIGSCGQYSILTTAVGKSALIPSVTVSARSEDHEWNEFWDGRWTHWDNSLGDITGNPPGPYIDWPDLYDKFSWIATDYGGISVAFQFRGDENIRVSRLYTEDAVLTISVEDSDGNPLDGAKVKVRPAKPGLAPRGMCVWGYTDSKGNASFYVGDNQDYYIQVYHNTFGQLPGIIKVISDSQPGQMYNTTVNYNPAAGQVPTLNATNLPSGADGLIKLDVNFTVISELQWCENELTKAYGLGIRYPVESPGDNIDFFIANSSEFEKYETGASFDSYELKEKVASDNISFQTYNIDDWYIVFSNEYSYETIKTINITVELNVAGIKLREGWNLISIPYEPSDTTITTVLSSIDGNYDLVWFFNASEKDWKSYNVNKPYKGDLWVITNKMGIWIHMTSAAILILEKTALMATDIFLHEGWNLVGYPSLMDRTLGDALSGIPWERVEGYDPNPNNPQHLRLMIDDDMMSAGNAYWIKVSNDCIWTVTN